MCRVLHCPIILLFVVYWLRSDVRGEVPPCPPAPWNPSHPSLKQVHGGLSIGGVRGGYAQNGCFHDHFPPFRMRLMAHTGSMGGVVVGIKPPPNGG